MRAPRIDELASALDNAGATLARVDYETLQVTGNDSAEIGELAARLGLPLHELTPINASLEDAYLALTQDEVEYRSEVPA